MSFPWLFPSCQHLVWPFSISCYMKFHCMHVACSLNTLYNREMWLFPWLFPSCQHLAWPSAISLCCYVYMWYVSLWVISVVSTLTMAFSHFTLHVIQLYVVCSLTHCTTGVISAKYVKIVVLTRCLSVPNPCVYMRAQE